MLEHQYTEASMKLPLLKGADLRKAAALKKACAETGMFLYLVSVQRMQLGSAEEDHDDDDGSYGRRGRWNPEEDTDEEDTVEEDEIEPAGESGHPFLWDVYEDKFSLTAVYDQDGQKIVVNREILETDIIQENPFKDEEPDEEDYEGYTGNAGASATHWYRSAGIVIVPLVVLPNFFALNSIKPSSQNNTPDNADLMLDYFVKKLMQAPPQTTERTLYERCVRYLCTHIVNYNLRSIETGISWNLFDNSLLANVVQGTLQLADSVLCIRALRAFSHIDNKTLRLIGDAMVSDQLRLSDFEASLEIYISQDKRLSSVHSALAEVLGGEITKRSVERGEQSGVSAWVTRKLDHALHSYQELFDDDVPILLLLCGVYGSTWIDALEQRILPVVRRHKSKTPFLIAFMNKLYTTPEVQGFLAPIFASLLPVAIKSLNIGKWGTFQDSPNKAQTGLYRTPKFRLPPIKGEEITLFLDRCHTMGFVQEVQDFLLAFREDAPMAHPSDMAPTWVTCLAGIAQLMPKWSIPYSESFYRTLFQTILAVFILKYVDFLPPPPQDWTANKVKCSCGDCALLNFFMQNPHQLTVEFKMAPNRRSHLQGELSDARADVTYEFACNTAPYTMIIKKTRASYEKAVGDWKERKAWAEQNLKQSFDETVLRTLLAEKYEEIVGMTQVTAPAAPRLVVQIQDGRARKPLLEAGLRPAAQRTIAHPHPQAVRPVSPSTLQGTSANSRSGNPGALTSVASGARTPSFATKRKAAEIEDAEVIDLTPD
ncbi:hypothetical protein BDV95DRAFT_574537 [Massariosphaeria phaeospora]|uniref:Uncharacterized protein n=1 Tax=Massariosphaeria phaeospora TaxID=100035 RepID=A0A7C8I4N2_9PLEO|nr:hypothetical protein BDV95DRAFT_574537 [Massariosphaeria phaeospora]